MKEVVTLSPLNKTWIFDLDGTIVKHNGYIIDGVDTLLDNAQSFFANIPQNDMVIILTAREEKYKDITINFLKDNNIRFDKIIFNVPMGERILINDEKPSGLQVSYAINTKRNEFMNVDFVVDENK